MFPVWVMIRIKVEKLDALQNGYKIYAYNVRDKFGDYGLVAVAIIVVAVRYRQEQAAETKTRSASTDKPKEK